MCLWRFPEFHPPLKHFATCPLLKCHLAPVQRLQHSQPRPQKPNASWKRSQQSRWQSALHLLVYLKISFASRLFWSDEGRFARLSLSSWGVSASQQGETSQPSSHFCIFHFLPALFSTIVQVNWSFYASICLFFEVNWFLLLFIIWSQCEFSMLLVQSWGYFAPLQMADLTLNTNSQRVTGSRF